jgi:hypothetical protein
MDSDSALTEGLRDLAGLSRPDLVSQFRDVFRKRPGPHISGQLIMLALAHRLQEQAQGGLNAQSRRQLGRLAAALVEGRPVNVQPKPRFRTGTRLLRRWRGQSYHVTVLAQGFEYDGRRYQSLSEIAREITGTRWSGPAFFGLRREVKEST